MLNRAFFFLGGNMTKMAFAARSTVISAVVRGSGDLDVTIAAMEDRFDCDIALRRNLARLFDRAYSPQRTQMRIGRLVSDDGLLHVPTLSVIRAIQSINYQPATLFELLHYVRACPEFPVPLVALGTCMNATGGDPVVGGKYNGPTPRKAGLRTLVIWPHGRFEHSRKPDTRVLETRHANPEDDWEVAKYHFLICQPR